MFDLSKLSNQEVKSLYSKYRVLPNSKFYQVVDMENITQSKIVQIEKLSNKAEIIRFVPPEDETDNANDVSGELSKNRGGFNNNYFKLTLMDSSKNMVYAIEMNKVFPSLAYIGCLVAVGSNVKIVHSVMLLTKDCTHIIDSIEVGGGFQNIPGNDTAFDRILVTRLKKQLDQI